jgi:predicted murein hydrolase (TIGR00659 family)
MMGDLLTAALAVAVTLIVYRLALALYRRTGAFVLNPVLVSIIALAGALLLLDLPFREYERGGRLLSFFLGPAVVALGVPLHRQSAEIWRRRRAIGSAVLAGSVVGVISGTLAAALLGAPAEVVRTLAPRSVTTPIALQISAEIGGIPALTAVLVILTGVFGAVVGPAVLRWAGVRSRTATGFALGAAAHGIGTARAAEEGSVEVASAGLAIGLMGVLTALLTPVLLWMLAAAGVLPP